MVTVGFKDGIWVRFKKWIGKKLRLTVVDTPGFGDAIDNRHAFGPIIEYIDKQFEVRNNL